MRYFHQVEALLVCSVCQSAIIVYMRKVNRIEINPFCSSHFLQFFIRFIWIFKLFKSWRPKSIKRKITVAYRFSLFCWIGGPLSWQKANAAERKKNSNNSNNNNNSTIEPFSNNSFHVNLFTAGIMNLYNS